MTNKKNNGCQCFDLFPIFANETCFAPKNFILFTFNGQMLRTSIKSNMGTNKM